METGSAGIAEAGKAEAEIMDLQSIEENSFNIFLRTTNTMTGSNRPGVFKPEIAKGCTTSFKR